MSDGRRGEPMQSLLERGELGLGDRQRSVLALADRRLEVVVEPFQLGQDSPDRLSSRRHLGVRERLHRVREGERVGDAGGARDPFGHEHGQLPRHLTDSPLGAPSFEEQPLSAVGNVLAAGLNEKLGRFEHTRANRPVGDHEHARTGEPLRPTVLGCSVLVVRERDSGLVELMGDELLQAWMTLRDDPRHIMDLAFEPMRSRD